MRLAALPLRFQSRPDSPGAFRDMARTHAPRAENGWWRLNGRRRPRMQSLPGRQCAGHTSASPVGGLGFRRFVAFCGDRPKSAWRDRPTKYMQACGGAYLFSMQSALRVNFYFLNSRQEKPRCHQTSPCCMLHVPCCMLEHNSLLHVVPGNMQHATCNMQQATRPPSDAHDNGGTCNVQHATCNMRHAAQMCSPRLRIVAWTRPTLPTICRATCNMQHATCNMRNATHDSNMYGGGTSAESEQVP